MRDLILQQLSFRRLVQRNKIAEAQARASGMHLLGAVAGADSNSELTGSSSASASSSAAGAGAGGDAEDQSKHHPDNKPYPRVAGRASAVIHLPFLTLSTPDTATIYLDIDAPYRREARATFDAHFVVHDVSGGGGGGFVEQRRCRVWFRVLRASTATFAPPVHPIFSPAHPTCAINHSSSFQSIRRSERSSARCASTNSRNPSSSGSSRITFTSTCCTRFGTNPWTRPVPPQVLDHPPQLLLVLARVVTAAVLEGHHQRQQRHSSSVVLRSPRVRMHRRLAPPLLATTALPLVVQAGTSSQLLARATHCSTAPLSLRYPASSYPAVMDRQKRAQCPPWSSAQG